LNESTETDLKSLVAEAVAAMMDAWEVKKKTGTQGGFLGWLTVKPTPHQTKRFLVLETSTVVSTKDMLNLQSPVTIDPRTEHVLPKQPPLQPSENPSLYDPPHSKEGPTSHCTSVP